MAKNPVILKTLLGVVGTSHIALGIVGLSGKKGMEVGAAIYGTRAEFDDQMRYIVRLASPYLISMGLLQLKAATNPQRHKTIIDVTLLIYLLNALHRIINRNNAYQAFGLTPAQLWSRVGFLGSMGLLMLEERLRLKDEAEPQTAEQQV